MGDPVLKHIVRQFRIASEIPTLAANLVANAVKTQKPTVGGQAVIEGVMMRSKTKVSWAVRRQDGSVAVEKEDFVSASQRTKWLGWPVMRGAVNLWETLALGYRALNRSAELAYGDEKSQSAPKTFKDSALSGLTMVGALLLSLGLFMYLPMLILTLLGFEKSALAFNLFAGIIRVSLFLGYLLLISLMKDVRRLFEYHGAEHKAIFTFEDGKALTAQNMSSYTTFHPRCGTSFVILVSLVCILLFSCIDAVFMRWVFHSYPLMLRLGVHLALIPLVSGVSYEVLKLSDRYQHIPPVRWLIQPGLWLQRITTRPPDESQLLVAKQALEAVL
jgi:uncharacterized protein YqhQ